MNRSHITTYKKLWPKRARKYPDKADDVCVYICRPGRGPLKKVIGAADDPNSMIEAQIAVDRANSKAPPKRKGAPLFGTWAAEYTDKGMEAVRLARTTKLSRGPHVKAFADRFGHLPMDQIGMEELGQWWDDCILGAGLSPETGRRQLSAFSSVYKWAIRNRVAVVNPTGAFRATVANMGVTKADRADQILTAHPVEEPADLAALDEIIRKQRDPLLYLAFLLMLDHGMRRGEAFAVRRCDMYLGEDPMDTRRHIKVRWNRPMGGPPETTKHGKPRGVPMSRRLREHILEFFADFAPERELMDRWPHPVDHLTATLLPRLCIWAGIPNVRPKDLRDTFASHLLTHGFRAEQIVRWIGHQQASVDMFHKRYAIWIGGESDWGYREPTKPGPGEVATDIFGVLCGTHAAPCSILQHDEQ